MASFLHLAMKIAINEGGRVVNCHRAHLKIDNLASDSCFAMIDQSERYQNAINSTSSRNSSVRFYIQ